MRPTEFAPGVTKGSGRWRRRLDGALGGRARADAAEPDAPLRARRRARRSRELPLPYSAVPHAPREGLGDRGFKETLTDWPALNARSKFWGDDQRAAFKNWEEIDSLHSRRKASPRTFSAASSCAAC